MTQTILSDDPLGDDLRSAQQSMIYRGSSRPHQKILWHCYGMKQGPHIFCHNDDVPSGWFQKLAE